MQYSSEQMSIPHVTHTPKLYQQTAQSENVLIISTLTTGIILPVWNYRGTYFYF
jgi:hypothetical protein